MPERVSEKKKKKKSKKKKGVLNIWAERKKSCENEQLRDWEKAWEQKFQEQEKLDDYRCCLHKGLCLKPKTQSNIWVNVIEDKMTQEVHMAFKHVSVPKPIPPPIPKLKRMEILSICEEKADKIFPRRKEKKVTKKKHKKRK